MGQLNIKGSDNGVFLFQGELSRDTLMDAWRKHESKLTRLKNAGGLVTVDLKEVSSVDTAGLAFLVNLVATTNKHQLDYKICNPPESLLKLAKISDVTSLLPLQ